MKTITARKRALLCVICAALLLKCLQCNAWAQPGVSTDKKTYVQGEKILVHFSGAPGLNRDWICIVPPEVPETDAGNYQYMPNGLQDGHLTFDAPAPGHYEVRAYYDYRRNGYVVSARHSFTVESQRTSSDLKYQGDTAESGPGVSTDKDTYIQGEEVQVRFSGAPGLSSDWISIVPSGTPDTDAGKYQYMPNGLQNGHLTFDAPALGHYEVRAYYNYRRNGYMVTARHFFTVESQASFSDKESNPHDLKLKQPSVTGKGRIIAATPLFAQDSAMADSLDDVPQGITVDILEEQKNFCKIRYNGLEGYVYSNFVRRETGK